jgi:hypothetical protein
VLVVISITNGLAGFLAVADNRRALSALDGNTCIDAIAFKRKSPAVSLSPTSSKIMVGMIDWSEMDEYQRIWIAGPTYG